MTDKEEKPRRMLGRSQQVFDALVAAGIIHEGDFVRRVIIDVNVADAVKIYVERFADSRLLDILPLLNSVEIAGTEERELMP